MTEIHPQQSTLENHNHQIHPNHKQNLSTQPLHPHEKSYLATQPVAPIVHKFLPEFPLQLLYKYQRMATIHQQNTVLKDKSTIHNKDTAYHKPEDLSSEENTQTRNRGKSLSISYNLVTLNKNSSFQISNSTGSKSVRGTEEENEKTEGNEYQQIECNKFCSIQLQNINSQVFNGPDQIQSTKALVGQKYEEEDQKHLSHLSISNAKGVTLRNKIIQQFSIVFMQLSQIENSFKSAKEQNTLTMKLQRQFQKISITSLQDEFQKLMAQNLSLEKTIITLQNNLNQSNVIMQQQKQKIRNLKRLYREVVLERQQLIFQNYNLSKKKQQQNIHSKQQIALLKTMIHKKIKPVRSKAELFHKDSQTIGRADTRSQVEGSQKYDQDDNLLSRIDKSDFTMTIRQKAPQFSQIGEETINNRRKKSVSEISNDFFFEIDKSQSGLKSTIDKLKQRIDQLQFELKIKQQTLAAIHIFIQESAVDTKTGDKTKMMDTLSNSEVKEKLLNSLKLAQQNAYLKKCMEKLSKSEVFWSRFQTPAPEQSGQDSRKESKQKCLLF